MTHIQHTTDLQCNCGITLLGGKLTGEKNQNALWMEVEKKLKKKKKSEKHTGVFRNTPQGQARRSGFLIKASV